MKKGGLSLLPGGPAQGAQNKITGVYIDQMPVILFSGHIHRAEGMTFSIRLR
jgi:hypothetical protein